MYHMRKIALKDLFFPAIFILLLFVAVAGCTQIDGRTGDLPQSHSSAAVTDAYGRIVTVPANVDRVVCSSGGPCVRYLVYLDAADTLAGVDSGDSPNSSTTTRDTRSYTLANPGFAELPVIGASTGGANLENILTIDPQLIFMIGSATNQTGEVASPADTMQERTGIPVIALPAGSYTSPEGRAELYSSYRLIGNVLGKEERAEELIAYIDATLADLDKRTSDIPETEQKSAYIGGLSYGGSHGLMSTQSAYPPFLWNHVKNIANGTVVQSTDFSKESLIYADPEFIFIDAGTLGVTDEIGGFEDIRSPVFGELRAVRNGNVYATLPYNYRSSNLDTILADAYFVGKTVYPERFTDIDPKTKADEIYTRFVGEPVFDRINANCDNIGFTRISLIKPLPS